MELKELVKKYFEEHPDVVSAQLNFGDIIVIIQKVIPAQ